MVLKSVKGAKAESSKVVPIESAPEARMLTDLQILALQETDKGIATLACRHTFLHSEAFQALTAYQAACARKMEMITEFARSHGIDVDSPTERWHLDLQKLAGFQRVKTGG